MANVEDYLARGDRDLAVFGPFVKGVNNRLSDAAMGSDMLRQAVNAYLDDAGRLSRRDGYGKLQNGTAAHSLYAGDEGVYFADGSTLYAYDVEADTLSALRTDLTQGSPIAWLPLNGELYYANGVQKGKIVASALRDWGVEVPAGIPALAATTGVLTPGRREVVCTFTNDEGEESGAGLSTGITLAATGGITVSSIPQPVSAEVAQINLYMTPANGDGVFYHAVSVPVGTASISLFSLSPTKELKTQFLVPPPAGRVLAYANGRIYAGDGRILWYTEPLAYGRCAVYRNFLVFNEEVTLAAGVKGGLYVAADKTYFLAGEPGAAELTPVLNYGAAFGSLAPVPTSANKAGAVWTWRSDRGQVLADERGQIVPLQEENLAMKPCSTGASLFVEVDGHKQIVSLGVPETDSSAEARDFVSMEVRRRTA